jgi:hypothetical protein
LLVEILIGKAPGQASGSKAYLPITIVDIQKFRSYWPSKANQPIGNLVAYEAEDLAQVLTDSSQFTGTFIKLEVKNRKVRISNLSSGR